MHLSKLLFLPVFLFTIFTVSSSEPPVQITTVLRSDEAWDKSKLPDYPSGSVEMTVNEYVLQPGAKTVVHLHPVNGSGYVIDGQLTMVLTESSTGDFSDSIQVKEITLGSGEAWNESVNKWHYGVNKGNKPVKFVVVFATGKNTNAVIPLGTDPN